MRLGKIFALVCVFCFSMSLIVCAAENEAVVSPALNVLSEESYVAMSCVGERTMSFDADSFERALDLSYVSTITVTRLPEKSEGTLYLGSKEVSVGQTVSRANIGYLNFEFSEESSNKSAFCFSANQGGYDIKCYVFSLKHQNEAPVHRIDGAKQVSTYKNINLYGRLDAYDAEGDRVIFELTKAPKNGRLELSADGEYVYIPSAGYVGSDSFKLVVQDEYGNYSGEREIKLNVELQKSSVVFSDISDDKHHIAAIAMTEKGIMSAQEVDGKFYFYPDAELGRLEFLVMAMKNMGIEVSAEEEKTPFADDSLIPASLKGYVNTAVKLGIVSGRINSAGEPVLAPNDKITRAEAAVMLNNMVELDTPVLKPVFADSNALPAWAEDAVYCLVYNGIMPKENGYVSASYLLDRDEAAYMLYMLTLTK